MQPIARISAALVLMFLATPLAFGVDVLNGEDVNAIIDAEVTQGGERVIIEGPADANDIETYTLTETIVVTEDMSPLIIEGESKSGGTRLRPDQIVLEGPGGDPAIEIEGDATLILRGLSITGGTTGVLVNDDGSLEMERCYINETGGEGVSLASVSSASIKSTIITTCDGDGIQVNNTTATDAGITIFQCTILNNTGAGVNAIAGDADVSACIVYNNETGLKGATITSEHNWVFKNTGNDYDSVTPGNEIEPTTADMDTAGTDPATGIFDPDPGIDWDGALLLPKLANKVVGGDVDYTNHPETTNDYLYRLRGEAGSLQVGAHEVNGVAAGGRWLVCEITTRGRSVDITLETEELELTGAQVILDPQAFPINVQAPLTDLVVAVDPEETDLTASIQRGSVNFDVPEGTITGTGPPEVSWDGEFLVYLDINAGGAGLAGVYGDPNGDYITTTQVEPTIEDRTFVIDEDPPVLAAVSTGRAFELIEVVGEAAADRSDFPVNWGGAVVEPSSYGTLIHEYTDPQFFSNVLPATFNGEDTISFTVAVTIIDVSAVGTPSGFLSATELAALGFVPDLNSADLGSVEELIYDHTLDEPGTIWLGRTGENGEITAMQDIGGDVTFALVPSTTNYLNDTLTATWTFNNVPWRESWHVVFRLRGMDRSGNELGSLRPLHLWWMDNPETRIVSASAGKVADPVIRWSLDRADAPDDVDPCPPIASFALFHLDRNTNLFEAVFDENNGWSDWTVDRSITRSTVVGTVQGVSGVTLGEVFEAYGEEDPIFGVIVAGADEAGNADPTINQVLQNSPVYTRVYLENLAGGARNFAYFTLDSEAQAQTAETGMQARFWHNVTHGRDPESLECVRVPTNQNDYTDAIRNIDDGGPQDSPDWYEPDFGASAEVPLPKEDSGAFSYRVEGRFDIAVTTQSNVGVGALWELTEDGRSVAIGVLREYNGIVRLQLPEDLLAFNGVGGDASPWLVALGIPGSVLYDASGNVQSIPFAESQAALNFLNARSASVDCDCDSGYTPDRLGDDGHYETEENCETGHTEPAHRRRAVTYELSVRGCVYDDSGDQVYTGTIDPTPATLRFVVYPPGQRRDDEQGIKEFARE